MFNLHSFKKVQSSRVFTNPSQLVLAEGQPAPRNRRGMHLAVLLAVHLPAPDTLHMPEDPTDKLIILHGLLDPPVGCMLVRPHGVHVRQLS